MLKIFNHNTKLTKAYLHPPKDDYDDYYLELVYSSEDEETITEVRIPKIRLPINKKYPVLNHTVIPSCRYADTEIRYTIDFGFGELNILPEDGTICKAEVLKKKMTLEQIEKELGYKIKLVSNDEKEKND